MSISAIDTNDSDYAIALRLSEELNQASSSERDQAVSIIDDVVGDATKSDRDKQMSCVDPRWETLDPIPDIRGLFLEFNTQFFWGRLAGIEVRWSPRMTLCAGLCCYEGRGGLCSVRLSVPLLKLRPRKDLVETLLHEMIHAYLFVTDNNKDHDGHGPEFCKHMHRINKATGANISIYHNFHDEVEAYRQHWWRCDGPCKTRKPYFGYVKRAMNRAPSARDPWWSEHQRTCGGNYTKVKEPENYKKKEKKNEDGNTKKIKSNVPDTKVDVNKNMDIRIFGGRGSSLGGGVSQTNTAAESGTSRVITNGIIQKSGNNVSTVTSSSISKPLSSGNDNSGKSVIVNGILKKDNPMDSETNLLQDVDSGLKSSDKRNTSHSNSVVSNKEVSNGHQNIREKLREVWGNKNKQMTTNSTSRIGTDVVDSKSMIYDRSKAYSNVKNQTGNSDLKSEHTDFFPKPTTSRNQAGLNEHSDTLNCENRIVASHTNNQSEIRQKDCGKKRPRDSDPETRKKKKQKRSPSKNDDQKIDSLFEKVMKKYNIKTKDNQTGDESTKFENVNETSEVLQACPVCSKKVPESSINSHLDKCLGLL